MNTATHPIAPEEVMAFLDGELSGDRLHSVSAHIDQCPECRDVARSLRTASQSLASWTISEVSPPLEYRIESASTRMHSAHANMRLGGAVRPRHWTRKRWVLTLTAAGGTFLLLLAVSIPNLRRSKMAANEASAMGRQRREGTEKLRSAGNARVDDADKLVVLPLAEKGRKQVPQALAQPLIARTVWLSIVVKDFDPGRAALDTILARYNGYAAGLDVSTPQGSARTLQASLRIPAAQLAAALAELKALGRVEVETQNGEEVTRQHADLVARLKNSRETEQRLQDVLRTRTGKVKEVLEVEEEIARVRGEIEQMETAQKTLEHRVDFATIDLKLAEEYKAQLSTPAPSVATQLRNAFVNGFRNAFESLLAVVLFFAGSGPTLLLWVLLLSFPAWLLWRRYRRSLALGSTIGA